MSRILALILVLGGLAGEAPALGLEDVGTTSADFLKLGSGARSEAMGEAYVGLADDADGIAYNPAGMVQNVSGLVQASHALWFQGLTYDNFNGLMPTGGGGMLGATFDYFSTPQIARTLLQSNGNYVNAGTFTPYDMQAAVSYARPLLLGLAGGVNLKLIDQSIDTNSGFGLALDLGALWQAPLRGLTLGFSLQNMGTPIKLASDAFYPPFVIRGGAAYRALDDAVILSVEGDLPVDNNPVLALGAEYNIADRFFPRIGWRHDGIFNPWTLGFGLRYDVWGLDLSAVPYGSLGMTYRAGVDWRFGRPGAGLSARLSYVSTVGSGKAAVLQPHMSAPDQVEAWGLYIYDGAHRSRIVRVFSGFGPLKTSLLWDGKDQNGRPSPEGVYWAVLSVRYTTGQTLNSDYVRLEVNNSAPLVSLSIAPESLNPNAAGEAFIPVVFYPTLKSGRGIAAWRLEILDPQGKVFRAIMGEGALPPQLIWDGKDDQGNELISAQIYSARLWVKDAFDSEGRTPAPVAFKAVFR